MDKITLFLSGFIERMNEEDWILLGIIFILLLDGSCDVYLLILLVCIFFSKPELNPFLAL